MLLTSCPKIPSKPENVKHFPAFLHFLFLSARRRPDVYKDKQTHEELCLVNNIINNSPLRPGRELQPESTNSLEAVYNVKEKNKQNVMMVNLKNS